MSSAWSGRWDPDGVRAGDEHWDECPHNPENPDYDWGYPCVCDEIDRELKEIHDEMYFDQMREEGW